MERINYKSINLYELISCLSKAGDLANPKLANHHQQVAYLSYKLAVNLNLTENQQKSVLLAGLLHDVGAVSFNEKLEQIEEEAPNINDHAFRGAHLLEEFKPLKIVSTIIRFHHIPWDNGNGTSFMGHKVPLLSHIIHLADRICVLIDPNKEILGQIENIKNLILEQKNTKFNPQLVDAFLDLSTKESIWLDLVNKSLDISSYMVFDVVNLDVEKIIDLSKIFSGIIDFRSPFTANHSAGVAKTAETLAKLFGFSKNECQMMQIAGYLHDLGKLAVSNEVLEKPGKLNNSDYNIIKCHTYYTYFLLQTIKNLKQ